MEDGWMGFGYFYLLFIFFPMVKTKKGDKMSQQGQTTTNK
jgi:hypothetical protein